MAFDGDQNLVGTMTSHTREIGGREAELQTWDRLLWRRVYDNAIAVVEGRTTPDALVNIAYIENKRALAMLSGNEVEASRLGRLSVDMEARYPLERGG